MSSTPSKLALQHVHANCLTHGQVLEPFTYHHTCLQDDMDESHETVMERLRRLPLAVTSAYRVLEILAGTSQKIEQRFPEIQSRPS